MNRALVLALLSALCFGMALITARVGLRRLDARAGAAISIPTATLLLVLAAPFWLRLDEFNLAGAGLFALVGLFFPALVTLLTFRANERLGPALTGAISGTAPLFALLAASLLLGEHIPAQAAGVALAVVAGVALMSWNQGALRPSFVPWALLWPASGALLRGLAQVGIKAALLLWPSAFAAALIGYLVSCAVVIGVHRRRQHRPVRPSGPSGAWFALTGLLNGSAVLLMYAALGLAPVSLVAPVVASYPLITVLASAILLKDEPLTLRVVAGALLTVAAIVSLVVSAT